MRNINYFNYSFFKTIRNKKNIFFITILTLCTITLLGSIFFNDWYFKQIDISINKNIDNRRLIVDVSSENLMEYGGLYEFDYSPILNISHIDDMYKFKYHSTGVLLKEFQNDDYNGVIELLYGDSYTLPNVVIGKEIMETDTGFAICPKDFYPSSEKSFTKKEKYIKSEDLLNTTFNLELDSREISRDETKIVGKYNKTFKIVGLYDIKENMNFPYQCYVSAKDLSEIMELNKNLDPSVYYDARTVVVDNLENIDYVKQEITKLGFDVSDVTVVDEEYLNQIKFICNAISFISILAIFLLTILYVKKKTNNSSYEIGLLKSIGYKNSEVQRLDFINIIMMSCLAYIIGIMFFEVIYIILQLANKGIIIYNNLVMTHLLRPYLISFIIIIIIPFIINYLFINRKYKKTALELLKGKNV